MWPLLPLTWTLAGAPAWTLPTFSDHLQEELSQALPECKAGGEGPSALVLTCPKQPYTLDVAGLYDRCGGARKACKGLIAELSDTLVQAVRPPPPTLGTTVPVVRSLRLAAEAAQAGGAPLRVEPLVGDLGVYYVHDSPTAMRYLTGPELDTLGIPASKLREKVLVGAISRTGGAKPVDLGHGAFVITGNEYVSSLILDAEPWATLAAQGTLLVSIPEQGTLLYATAEGGQKALPGLTLEVYSRSKHPLSTAIYQWTPHGLVERP